MLSTPDKTHRTSFDVGLSTLPFRNYFPFSKEERARVHDSCQEAMIGGAAIGALMFGVGIILVPLLIFFARRILERELSPVYGLCGGMCYTALDCHSAGVPVSRLTDGVGRPTAGSVLHRYLWRRQLDSWIGNGVRFGIWTLMVDRVPNWCSIRGGAEWLGQRTQQGWRKVKSSLDADNPVPIGLVREGKKLTANHQVVAVGYEEPDEEYAVLYVYDPNCPGKESVIHLRFGSERFEGQEMCSGVSLRGFFVERYRVKMLDRILGEYSGAGE